MFTFYFLVLPSKASTSAPTWLSWPLFLIFPHPTNHPSGKVSKWPNTARPRKAKFIRSMRSPYIIKVINVITDIFSSEGKMLHQFIFFSISMMVNFIFSDNLFIHRIHSLIHSFHPFIAFIILYIHFIHSCYQFIH